MEGLGTRLKKFAHVHCLPLHNLVTNWLLLLAIYCEAAAGLTMVNVVFPCITTCNYVHVTCIYLYSCESVYPLWLSLEEYVIIPCSFSRTKLHTKLSEGQDKVVALLSGREQVYTRLGEWFVWVTYSTRVSWKSAPPLPHTHPPTPTHTHTHTNFCWISCIVS